MTRTVTDLVAALRPDDGADEVDTRRFLVETARRRKLRRARQRMLAAAATALAAVLLIAGVPFALANLTGATVTPASPSPAVSPQPTDTVAPISGRPVTWQTLRRTTAEPWVIEPCRRATGSSSATSSAPTSRRPAVRSSSSTRARSMRARCGQGRSLTVGGRAAYYTVTFVPFSGDEQGNNRTEEPTIGWEYAPDAWVIVQGTFNEPTALAQPADGTVPATLLRVAEAVTIGPATPARMPFVLSYVPEGLHVVRGFFGWPGAENASIEFDRDAAPHDWRDQYRDLSAPLIVSMMEAAPEPLAAGYDARRAPGDVQRTQPGHRPAGRLLAHHRQRGQRARHCPQPSSRRSSPESGWRTPSSTGARGWKCRSIRARAT